ALLRLVVPRYALVTQIDSFLAVLLPAILWLRVKATGLRLWSSRPVENVLVVGIGPLGRLTGAELRDGGKRVQVIGHLRFPAEPMHSRLYAPVFGTIGDLDKTLKEQVVNEVYFAATASHQRADVQAAISTCEKFGIPFALPACGYRLSRATPACEKAIAD